MKNDKASATALLIAKSQLLLAKHPTLGWIVNSQRSRLYYECLMDFSKKRGIFNFLEKYYLILINKFGIPGIYLHYALRKLYIEKTTLDILKDLEVKQVVVIAAGFDPLSPMLCEQHPTVNFFELDHPATQRHKRDALGKISNICQNLKLIPIDLTTGSIDKALQHAAFMQDVPTLFIAEGITMYLTQKQIKDFFSQIRSLAKNKNSYFLFTYMNQQDSGSIQFESASPLVNWWLSFKEEVFKWGIRRPSLQKFLEDTGFNLIKIIDHQDFFEEYLAPNNIKNVVLARGENICLARIIPA